MTSEAPRLEGTRAPRLTRDRLRHDLCTPINHVLGYTDLLLEEPIDGASAALLAGIRETNRLGKRALETLDRSLRGPERGDVSYEQIRAELVSGAEAMIATTRRCCEDAAALPSLQPKADLAKVQAAAENLRALALELLAGDTATPVSDSGPWRVPTAAALRELRPVPAALDVPRARVLVIDDDLFNRDLMSRRLEAVGHEVTLAEDGLRALSILERERFDLILLDVVMPVIDGYEVLQRLKASPALKDIPVIVLSGLNQVSGAVKCIELGAEDYLPKPPEEVLLRARIGASLEKKRLRDQEIRYLQRIEEERKRADDLLKVILPEEIAHELKQTNTVLPRRHDHVAVMFVDIVGFTPYCERMPPDAMLRELQALTERFEDLALEHDIQKIKTIGDAFMAASGLLRPVANPTLQAVRCGAGMIEAARALPPYWTVRVGIHVGPVVAGVLGRRQYLFDLWGDTVNTAARVESYGVPGSVTLSPQAWAQVKDACTGRSLGSVDVKGKGPMEIFRFEAFR